MILKKPRKTFAAFFDVLIAGACPNDGWEKPVSFPAPENVAEKDVSGVPFVNLPTLTELRIASGMTADH